LNDPIFGKTQAGIYTQFHLSSLSVNFGDNVVVDSIVLTLVYAGYYGDTLNSFKLNVYELDEDMSKSKNYYTKDSLKYKSGSLTNNPNLYISPRPTTRPDTVSSVYYFSVKLKKDFADNFLSKSGTDIKSDDDFLKNFKGLYLEASDLTGNGCMLSINMTHSMSKLTIYYRKDEKNLNYSFIMNDSTAHFGVFNHFGYADATSNLREQLNGNPTSTKEILYAQAGAGIKVSLRFPHLKEKFNNQKVIIHRAALIFSQKEDAMENYFPPSALIITYTDPATGIGYLLPDYFLGSDYFGGKYNQTKKEYYFNITQYIQRLVDGRGDDYLLNLFVNPSVTHFSRLMIHGTEPSDIDKRLKLKINYTIVN
jgi:hypothetical protein